MLKSFQLVKQTINFRQEWENKNSRAFLCSLFSSSFRGHIGNRSTKRAWKSGSQPWMNLGISLGTLEHTDAWAQPRDSGLIVWNAACTGIFKSSAEEAMGHCWLRATDIDVWDLGGHCIQWFSASVADRCYLERFLKTHRCPTD